MLDDQSRGRRRHGGDVAGLPETIESAVVNASREIAASEPWAQVRRRAAGAALPALLSTVSAAGALLPRESVHRKILRQTALKIFAYLPADLRLMSFIDLAARDPAALDDLFTGDVADKYMPYRYNLLSTLGVFARHGLVEEVFTADRVRHVGRVMGSLQTSRGDAG